jgi:hypothetical protein
MPSFGEDLAEPFGNLSGEGKAFFEGHGGRK